MLKFMPVGFIGLMVGGLIAANSSTILTHLNWGASYLVHDLYRRFLRTDATERHYVMVGRVVTGDGATLVMLKLPDDAVVTLELVSDPTVERVEVGSGFSHLVVQVVHSCLR